MLPGRRRERVDLPVWGFVLVAVVCLLQVPATHYLSRYFEVDEDDRDESATPVEVADHLRDARADEPGVCERCGTHNDPATTYCVHCQARV
jgi:hypothetical protein